MAKAIALVNGKNFVHKDIIFNYGGVPVLSLSSLDASEKTIKEFSYGTGSLPVGIGEGRDEAVEVNFEISMTDFISLRRAAGVGGIRRLGVVDIPVTFANSENPSGLVIKNFAATENSFSSDIDTTDIKVPIVGIASHIEWK